MIAKSVIPLKKQIIKILKEVTLALLDITKLVLEKMPIALNMKKPLKQEIKLPIVLMVMN